MHAKFSRIVVVAAAAIVLGGCNGDRISTTSLVPTTSGSATPAPGSTGAKPPVDSEIAEILATLPAPDTQADVVGVPLPTGELAEIAAALQEAIAADPEWFAQHMGSVGPGEPLPYDPRLGVTQAEYEFMLESFENVEPAFVGVLTIGTSPVGNGRLSIAVPTQSGGQAALIYDPARNTFESPYGTTGPPVAWEPEAGSFLENAVGWRWEAVDAALEGGGGSDAPAESVEITIAVAGSGERIYLGVVGGRSVDGTAVEAVDLDLIYDAPSD